MIFLSILTVEINGNTFENHTREQGHSNSLQQEFMQEVLSDLNFLGYKDPTNVFGFESSGFIIYL